MPAWWGDDAGRGKGYCPRLKFRAVERDLGAGYNCVRIDKAVKMTPVLAAGVSQTLRTMDNIVALIDAAAPAPAPRGPSKKTKERTV